MNNEKGFSLTEVLVAIAMITIIMTALLGTLPDILKLNRSHQDSMLIVQTAQQYMETVSSRSSELLTGELSYLPDNPSQESFKCNETIDAINSTTQTGPYERLRISLSCYPVLDESDIYDFVLELGK